jgi:hypothetical protein
MTGKRLVPAVLSLAIFLSAVLLACSHAASEGEPVGEPGASIIQPDGTAMLRLVNEEGKSVTLAAEIADDAAEMQKGLSMRESLDPDAGMLFVFHRPSPGFWMKDTSIPLSVAFIAKCGEIVHIAHMEPLSLQIHNAPGDYYFGLEVNRGWFEEHAIAVGDRVLIPEAYRVAGCA